MPRFKLRLIALGLALLGPIGPGVALAEQDDDIAQLLVQGHFWYERGRLDLSEKAWRKVLLVEPNNAEALAGLKELERANLDQLDQAKLNEARALALAGRYKEALALYQAAFNGPPPTSYYSSEYYLTMGGTEDGWTNAHSQMTALARTYPSNTAYALALAKLKTYRENTRRDGIRRLQDLATRADLRDDAIAAWRQALLWLETQSDDEVLFREYLGRVPDDTQVEARLQRINTRTLAPVAEGYEALEAKNPSAAARAFEQALTLDPNDVDALAGLGIIRLRQQRFTEAQRYLRRAVELDPSRKAEFGDSLNDANFWSVYAAADSARRKGDLRSARRAAQRAEKMRPRQPEVLALRARIERALGNHAEAEQYFQRALKLQPKNRKLSNELAGLAREQVALEEAAQAEAAALNVEPIIQMADDGSILNPLMRSPEGEPLTDVEAFRLRAEAEATQDPRRASELLEQALALDPDNAWVRLDLARLYRRQNLKAEAIALIDEMVQRRPDDITTHHVKALFHAEALEWAEALRAIERIPENQRSEEQSLLHQHLWGNLKNTEARAALAREDYAKARSIAAEIEFNERNNPELMLIRAELFSDLGDRRAALRTAHQARVTLADGDTDLALRYATVLLKTGQRGDLRREIDRLRQQNGNLTQPQRAVLEKLELDMALQTADDLRQQGEYDAALASNRPALNKHGNNPQVLLTQATIHKDAGDYPRALDTYRQVTRIQPKNRFAWTGAAGTAMAMRDYENARATTEAGLAQLPDEPELLSLRAQLSSLRGEQAAAAADLEKALALYKEREKISALPYLEVDKAQVKREESWVSDARARLARLDTRKRDEFDIGVGVRARDGDAGLGELTQQSAPIQYVHAPDHDTRWGVEVIPTQLDADAVDGNTYAVNQFGSLALTPGAHAGTQFDQEAEGVAANVSYESRRFSGDLGVTPLGFTKENIVGSAKWKDQSFDHKATVGFERRAVQETLLSYAGTTDPGTGRDWGGVTRTGLAMSFDRNFGATGIYGDLGFYYLRGDNVVDNREAFGQLGTYWSLVDQPDQSLKLGMNLQLRSFEENLRFFTLGHGGYFSPRRFISLTFPMGYEGTSGKLRYALHADIGVQDYSEDNASVFPRDPGLQAQLETLAGSTPGVVTRYAGEDKTEFVYNLRARMEYLTGRNWATGGWLTAASTQDYREYSGGLYLRYLFAPNAESHLDAFGNSVNPFRQTW
ncbi:MAG: cellulose synthase subunit BcsC-related outer membrane protein [Thiotrichales bacterium]